MSRDEILAVLREFKRMNAEKYNILEIGVFGSFARDEAEKGSDVDIVFKTDKPNLYRRVRMKQALEVLLGRQVDLVRWREGMNPRLKRRIAREARYV